MMPASVGRWRSIRLSVAALVVALAGLEGALQIAALFVKDAASRSRVAFLTSSRRVLFLGDSNTYGLYVEPAQAYPRGFERAWNERHPERPVEVLNLAYPGMNSSRVLRELPRMLRAYRPHVVAVMVGANDYWTVPAAPAAHPSLASRINEALWERVRTYRLFFLLWRSLATRAELKFTQRAGSTLEGGSATAQYGGERFELGWQMRHDREGADAISADLARNLFAIREAVRHAGAELLLLTYPAEQNLYLLADRQLRSVASETSTPFVDLAARFRPRCGSTPCDLLFPDQHPTAAGHAMVTQHLVEALGQLALL